MESSYVETKVELGTTQRPQQDYIPFGMQYQETPKPAGYNGEKICDLTSVTFSTFRGIPLIDDED